MVPEIFDYRNMVLKDNRLKTFQGNNCYSVHSNSSKGNMTETILYHQLLCRKKEIILVPYDLYPHKFLIKEIQNYMPKLGKNSLRCDPCRQKLKRKKIDRFKFYRS